MSVATEGLLKTLDLLRRVLNAEGRQGYRNTAAVGGIHRYFQEQFARHSTDDAMALAVEGLLQGLQRYERATVLEERQAQAAILRRRVDELVGSGPGPAPAVGAVTPQHRGDAVDLARVRRPRVSGAAARAAALFPAAESAGWEEAAPVAPPTVARPRPEPPPDLEPIEAVAPAAEGLTTRPQAARAAPQLRALGQALHEAVKIRPQEREKLERLGMATVEDALYYVPREHYDCRNPVPLNKLRLGMTTTIIGTLHEVNLRRSARKLMIVEARVSDGTAQVRITWINQAFIASILRPKIGQRLAISGHTDLYNGRLQFVPRDYEFPDDDEATHTARLVPIYSLTEGLTQRWMRSLLHRVLDAALPLVEEPLPAWLRLAHDLPTLGAALRAYHFPDDEEAKAVAVRRLAFDELLYIAIGMARRKRAWQESAPAEPIAYRPEVVEEFTASLPFALTGAQRRALEAILRDMERTVPMSCLLQGDVGSGKTVVAAAALFMAARAGLQGAMMAPTELLAEQHARSLTRLLEPFGLRVALLTGSVKGVARRRIYSEVASSEITVLVGTHALIQEGVAFERLGLAVVDEQHRFGVEQRALLRQKGSNPHLLAMTATPIPRTLSLTIYGDLDVAVIDERPPGRHPVETTWEGAEVAAWDLIREQVALGRQAYVICPLVEESERSDARAAVAEQKRLQAEVFPTLRVGLLHGKMKSIEKETVLGRFRDGGIDVLVATSVVEVGIDVPNATVMVVEEANRFGLAQLHQFRGRVGRGAERSYCILLAQTASSPGQQRLQAITATDDGFVLAEEDLKMRGPGEFWGTRQSGLPQLKVAGLGDMRTVEEARLAATQLLERDPELAAAEHSVLVGKMERFWARGSELS